MILSLNFRIRNFFSQVAIAWTMSANGFVFSRPTFSAFGTFPGVTHIQKSGSLKIKTLLRGSSYVVGLKATPSPKMFLIVFSRFLSRLVYDSKLVIFGLSKNATQTYLIY